MKIAVISTTVFPCPPAGYAGLEMIAWQCAQGFAKLGHQVLLVAPKGSQGGPNITLHETTQGESEKQAYSGYWQRLLTDADVVVDHSWQKWSYILKVEGRLKAPILGVCHAPINTMYNVPPPVPKPCMIAISKDQANAISQHLGVPARVCYNGVDLEFYKPGGPIGSSQRNDRYLFLARMSTVKSPHIAIDIANKTRVGLDLVGDDTITGEPAYVQRVRELAVNNIKYIGPQTRSQCVEWFNRNKCLLHTAKFFREPFGLAPIEAQACFTAETLVRATGVNDVYRSSFTGRLIQVACGKKLIECTPEHPFLTQRGWVPAKELTTQDFLVKRIGNASDNMDSERIGDFTKRVSDAWETQDGSPVGAQGNAGRQQSEADEAEQGDVSPVVLEGRQGAAGSVLEGGDGGSVSVASGKNDQADSGSGADTRSGLHEGRGSLLQGRNTYLAGKIFSFGAEQNRGNAPAAHRGVDQAQSTIDAVVQDVVRQVEIASGYIDKTGFGLHGGIHRRGRQHRPQEATGKKEQNADGSVYEHVVAVDPVVSVEVEGAERSTVHEEGGNEGNSGFRPVSCADRSRSVALPVVQGAVAVLEVETSADGNSVGVDRIAVHSDKTPAHLRKAAVVRAHDGLYEFEAITHLGGREVEGLPVFNLGTETGTYEAAGFIVHNCGMPVISFGNGAMRETIKDGETGFVVDDEAQFVELIKRDAVSLLKPRRIREWAAQFSVENSIKQYMLAIEEALAGGW